MGVVLKIVAGVFIEMSLRPPYASFTLQGFHRALLNR